MIAKHCPILFLNKIKRFDEQKLRNIYYGKKYRKLKKNSARLAYVQISDKKFINVLQNTAKNI